MSLFVLGTGYPWFSTWGYHDGINRPYNTVCLAREPNTKASRVPLNVRGHIRYNDRVRLYARWAGEHGKRFRVLLGTGYLRFNQSKDRVYRISMRWDSRRPDTATIKHAGKGWNIGAWQLVVLEVLK